MHSSLPGSRRNGVRLSLAALVAVTSPPALGQTVNQYGNCNAGINSSVTCHIYGASKRELDKLSEIVSEAQVGVTRAEHAVRENHEEILELLQRIGDLEDRETLTQDGDPELRQKLEDLIGKFLQSSASEQQLRAELDELSQRVGRSRNFFNAYSRSVSAIALQAGYLSEAMGEAASGKHYTVHGAEFELTFRQRLNESWLVPMGLSAGVLASTSVSGVELVSDTQDRSVLGTDSVSVRTSFWQLLGGVGYETGSWLFTVRSGVLRRQLEFSPQALPSQESICWETPLRLGVHGRVLGGFAFFLDAGTALSFRYAPLRYVLDSDRIEPKPSPRQFALHAQGSLGVSYAYSL